MELTPRVCSLTVPAQAGTHSSASTALSFACRTSPGWTRRINKKHRSAFGMGPGFCRDGALLHCLPKCDHPALEGEGRRGARDIAGRVLKIVLRAICKCRREYHDRVTSPSEARQDTGRTAW